MAKETGNWSKKGSGTKAPHRSTTLQRADRSPSSRSSEEMPVWIGANRYRTPELKGEKGAISPNLVRLWNTVGLLLGAINLAIGLSGHATIDV